MSLENLIVKNYMIKIGNFPVVKSNQILKEAVDLMDEYKLGIVSIVDNNFKLLGVITDGDLRRAINKNLLNSKVSLIMKKDPFVIKENLLCTDALYLMNEKKISCLFVENKMKPIGIVHIHDCLKLFKD